MPRHARGARPGEVVVVTGASSGIGRDAALYLCELGYTVIATVRKERDAKALRADATGGSMVPVLLDVTRPEDLPGLIAAVDQATAPGGGLNAVFSNAGIAAYDGDLSCEGCPLETQERVLEVNHLGAVRVIQALLPSLRRGKGTVVVNTALMTHTVIPFNAGYAASKAALEAWCDTLRREVRSHGVKVVVIRAAAIASEMGSKQDPDAIPTDTPYPEQRALAKRFLGMVEAKRDDPKLSPRRFSEKVVRAIQKPDPAPKQIVGGGAVPIWLLGCLPERVQDAIFARVLASPTETGDPRQRDTLHSVTGIEGDR